MTHWFQAHKRKIQEIGAGLFIWESWNFLYDWLFYPFAIAYWGVVAGGILVTVISVIVNGFVFWLYEYMRVDWLGAHALRELEDKENKSNIEKLATWLGKQKTTLREKILSPIVFIGLTLPIDPLIVAIHYRKNHFRGLGTRDWLLLIGATLAANAWWLLKIGLIVEAAKFLWLHFLLLI
ncbi:MAG: hypothetical protein V4480_02845 [Patescibacteria group bacterium]